MVDYVNQKVSPNDQWLFDTDGDLIGVRNPRVRGRDLTPVTSAEHLLDNLTVVTSSGVTAASDSLPIAVSGVMAKISIDELQKSAAPQSATTPTYGSDLLAGIGAFPSATGWTLGSGWSISGGQAVYTSGGGTLDATISVTSGVKYQIDWTHVAGSYNATFTAGAVSTMACPYWGNKSVTFVAGTTGSVTLSIAMNAGATIDALTVRQVLTAGRAVVYQAKDASGAVAFAPSITALSLYNTASGVSALQSNTTGYKNTANGASALYSNTTGYSNTANGVNALLSNTTGHNNVASGVDALQSNTSGYYNTASGVNALYSNTTGYNNTASGGSALRLNTTGYGNTASGVSALYSNTTGYYNTASGLSALYSNTTGYNNTASGVDALSSNTTGYSNTASGVSALQDVTTGYNNTAVGRNTGRGITTGTGNTVVGANVTGLASGLTNNIIVANGDGTVKAQHDGTNWTFAGGVALDKTITAGGTTGAQTINKPAGSVNFAATATSLVVTNSLVTTSSVIVCTVGTNDATMKSVSAVAGSGSFTIYADAGATAETRVNFLVIN